MKTIYLDSEYKCHISNDGTMTAVETDFFDGRCDTFVAGYCYDISKGYVQIYPWKPYVELDAAQRQYEQEQLAEYTEELKTLKNNIQELNISYNEGVNSI